MGLLSAIFGADGGQHLVDGVSSLFAASGTTGMKPKGSSSFLAQQAEGKISSDQVDSSISGPAGNFGTGMNKVKLHQPSAAVKTSF